MSNYTGLIPIAGLLLGLALTNALAAEKAPVPTPAAAEATELEANRASTDARSADDASTINDSSDTDDESAADETAPSEAAPAKVASAATAAPTIKSGAPLRYEVKKGDTLWGIAGYFLQNPWQWPEIWYSNDQIKNPHRIYPGNVLKLVMIGGRPRLVMDGAEVVSDDAPLGPLKLSPKVRSNALAAAIPTIPLEAIRDFIKGPQMIGADDLDKTPVIVAFTDENIVGGAGMDFFAKGLTADSDGAYKIVRKGDAYRDPDTGKIIGYEAVPVGLSEPKRYDSDKRIAQLRVTETTREVRIGDRLQPVDDLANFDAYFYPRVPQRIVKGRIISVFDGASQIGRNQIVALNRGLDDGLAPGNVLTVMQTGRTVPNPDSWFGNNIQLPDTDAGMVMVFKVMPHFSYALVMKATRAIHAADKVVTPE